MRRTIKQSISALLAAVMLLSLCPVPRAGAAGTAEDGTEETEIIWTQEVNKLFVAAEDSKTIRYIDSTFNHDINYSDNGYFLVTYDIADIASDDSNSFSLGFALQIGNGWDWYGSSVAPQINGEAAAKYDATSFAYNSKQWSADSDDIQAVNLSLYGAGRVTVTLKKIEYFTDTSDTSPATLTIPESDAKLPIDDMTNQYEVGSVIEEKDPEQKGFFRVTYRDESDNKNSTLALQRYTSNYSYIDGDVSGTPADESDDVKYIDFPGSTVLANGSDGKVVGRIAAKISTGKVTIQKIEYYAPKKAIENDDSKYNVNVDLYTGSHELSTNLDVSMDSVKDRFVPQMITPGGKFRLTFASGASGTVKLSFGNKDDWSWPNVEETINNGQVEISYDAFSQAWGTNELSNLWQISVVNNVGTITNLKWLGNTPFSGEEQKKCSVTLIARSEENGTMTPDTGFAKDAFKKGGQELGAVSVEDDGLKLEVDSNTVITVLGATSWGRYLEDLTVTGSGTNTTSGGFKKYTDQTIQVTGDVTITADYKWYESKPGSEDPDPPTPPTPVGALTRDENGVVTIPNNQGDGLKFSGYITPGGYFRVEYTLNDGAADADIQLTMEPNWVSVSEASLDKDGKSRKGNDGNTYYVEFSYDDCEKVWKAEPKNNGSDLDTIKKVFPQYNWSGPDSSDFPKAIASYTVKYYPTDTKAAHPLGDGTAVVGAPISTDVSGKSYQWYRVVGNATVKGTAIDGAAGAAYTPTEDDKGCWLYCVIDSEITAGPAAVVVSKTNKTTSVFNGSKSVVGGDSTDLWTPSSAGSTFNKAMIVPNGSFRMKCDPVSEDVKLVLKEPWKEITGREEDGDLVFDYDALLAGWAQNFGNIGEIDVKNTGSSSVTITSLEWTGYDIGVEEAPYMPTDYLPFGGSAWEKDWLTNSVTQDTGKNLLTATVTYDGGEWSVARLKTHSDTGFIVNDNNMVSLNVYIDKSAMDAGKGEMLFQIVDCTDEFKLNTSGEENVVTVNGREYYRTPLNLFVPAFPARFNDFILAIRGKNSGFDGTILVDNIILRKNEGEKEILIDENGNSLTNGSITVTVSEDSPGAYYGDAVKAAVKLDSKPAEPVKVTITLNNDPNTKSSKDIPADQFRQGADGGWTAETEVPVPCTVGGVEKVKVDVAYSGSVELTNLAIVSKGEITQTGDGAGSDGGGEGRPKPITLPYTWEFANRTFNAWKYEPGWNSDYSGKSGTRVAYRDGRMEVEADYSKDGDKSWSQMAVTLWHNEGMLIKNATHVCMDLYYVPEKLDGSLAVKLYSGGAGIDVEGSIRWDKAETVKINGTVYKKVRVDFDFPPVKAEKVHDMALCLIGRNTTYCGSLLIEKLTIEERFAGSFVMSTRRAKSKNSTLRTWQDLLVTSSDEKVKLPKEVVLADGQATTPVRSVYSYLQAVGSSKDVLFGQQYNFGQKAGSTALSDSDTYDIVGDYAAVYGLDALALTGDEFSASRCNQMYGTPFPSTAEGNVVAAAYLTNTAIKRGAIVTLSCHMPNFSQVKTITPNCSASYARYDFSGYTPNVLTGNTANEILPGGKYNEMFNAYLDMIADYANRVNGAVLFRPFHENTGSWFWWGKDFCEAETYQNLYRYTVEYLRDEKGVHNFLYVYSPGSEAESLTEYAERYPGDGYVDIVGFDMYNRDPDADSDWMSAFKRKLDLVSQFAADHGKLVAVTETGAASDTVEGDDQTALLRTGNKDKDWFRRVLDVMSDSPASYLLVWANFGQTNGFYTPYVIRTEGRQLYGHEMMDNFIDYYNDPRSVFASDQKSVLGILPVPTARAANGGSASGFRDVPVNAWYRSAVEYVAQKGLMSGVGSDMFEPGASMTRAMMVQVLYNMEGRPETSEQSAFQDVANSAWYAPAIKWAVSKKIVTGYDNTRFGPEDKITREQMTVVLYNYAKMKRHDIFTDVDLNVFTDVGDISPWALESVRWANGTGLLNGMGDGTLAPDYGATRAQLASILMRFCEKIA